MVFHPTLYAARDQDLTLIQGQALELQLSQASDTSMETPIEKVRYQMVFFLTLNDVRDQAATRTEEEGL